MTMTCGLRQLREVGQEALDRVLGRRCRQDESGLRIAKRRIETFGVAGQFGGEQRHRNGRPP